MCTSGRSTQRLRDFARRIHNGLILNGGFVEREAPDTDAIVGYDMLGELNAGNYFAGRSNNIMVIV